jgi:hypothetical protein
MIPRIVDMAMFDNVLLMLSEMNKEKFEEVWALPTLERLCQDLDDITASKNTVRLFKYIAGAVRVQFHTGQMMSIGGLPEPGSPALAVDALNKVYQFLSLREIDAIGSVGTNSTALLGKKLIKGQLGYSTANLELLSSIPSIELTEGDNVWIIETSLGDFVTEQVKFLSKLRVQVKYRVTERQAGLVKILSG